jgi:hypothetical protein
MICLLQVLTIAAIIGGITRLYVYVCYRVVDKETKQWLKERDDWYNKRREMTDRWRKEGRWPYE